MGQTRNVRIVLAVLTVLVAFGTASVALADPRYEVMNAPEGVYWRSEPNWTAAERVTGFGVYNGTIVEVHCYKSGTAVEGSADTMWEQASDVGGSGYGSGWLNEHFINDGQPIDQASPGVPACDAAAPSPSPAPPASSPAPSPSPSAPSPSSPAASSPAGSPSPTCFGDYCSGKSATKTHCVLGAATLAANGRLSLAWSARCKTKWAKMIVPAGWWAPSEVWAEQNTGYSQSAGIGGHYAHTTEILSPMIYSPKKCVEAWYNTAPGYSWNAEHTSCR